MATQKHIRTIFISDIHFPYQDKKALSLAMEIIKNYKLTENDNIIIGGDLMDFYPFSTFPVDLLQSNIETEIEQAKAWLNDLRKIAKTCSIYYFRGNHEERLQKTVLTKLQSMSTMLYKQLSLWELLDLKTFNIKFVDAPFTLNKKLYFVHGHEKKSMGQPQHIANLQLKHYNRPVIFGHHHRFDMTLATQLDSSLLGAWGNGCLCDLSLLPTGLYTSFDNSQKGITVVYEKNSGLFSVQQHIFIPNKKKGYECIVNEKDYII
jgi:UDP-2,3-diacylglucosamine pyrophosphatase LpxH